MKLNCSKTFHESKTDYSLKWEGKVLAGDIDPAIRTHIAFFSVWKRYGFTPEGFNLASFSVQVTNFIKEKFFSWSLWLQL